MSTCEGGDVLETSLADADTYRELPAEELDKLLAEAGKIRVALEKTEEQWLSASADLEAAQDA